VDKQSFDLKSLSYHLFLLVKIAMLLFPSLNFIEDGTDVITWLTNSLLSINDPFQVTDGLVVRELVMMIHKLHKAPSDDLHHLVLLWTRFFGSRGGHEVVKRWLWE
jgi:hypothetical protein